MTVLGTVGYVGKGIAVAVVGVLIVVAGVRSDPDQATGLDGAFDALRDLPAGSVVLVAVGVGFLAYGVYSFFEPVAHLDSWPQLASAGGTRSRAVHLGYTRSRLPRCPERPALRLGRVQVTVRRGTSRSRCGAVRVPVLQLAPVRRPSTWSATTAAVRRPGPRADAAKTG